jgi:hypothetical protein
MIYKRKILRILAVGVGIAWWALPSIFNYYVHCHVYYQSRKLLECLFANDNIQ